MSKYSKLFKIKKTNKKTKPYYQIHINMDSNDGDYISGDLHVLETYWDNKDDIFFLMLAYLGNGYSGKFSHGKDWSDYYGHHYKENAHGLSKIINYVAEAEDWIQYSDWGACHSFSDITISYYDENNKKSNVTMPSIDDMFDTEEEMIETIKEAYKNSSYYDESHDEI